MTQKNNFNEVLYEMRCDYIEMLVLYNWIWLKIRNSKFHYIRWMTTICIMMMMKYEFIGRNECVNFYLDEIVKIWFMKWKPWKMKLSLWSRNKHGSSLFFIEINNSQVVSEFWKENITLTRLFLNLRLA